MFRTMTVAAALLTATAVAAQTPAEPVFLPAGVRAHVAFLADDLLEGRNAGERGFDLAARYVATRFEALGLKPAGADGGWYQVVPFKESKLGGSTAALSIGGRRFENATSVLVAGNPREPKQSVEAPVVFVGYGIEAADYAGLDVKGKIVAVLSGFPKGMASDVGAHLSSDKARFAETRGAIGVVTIPTIERMKLRPWAQVVKYAGEPSLNWVGEDGQPYSAAPAIRVSAVLDRPASDVLFAGAPATIASILATADQEGGRPRGFALKPTVRLERQTESRSVTSPNVVAILPGSDPALANEYVVLMAHLDHDGVDEKLTGDKTYNGAMDNAAGTATMLEVARALAEGGVRPKRSILFAAVTAEEDGLLGSQYLAKHPVVAARGKVVGVVNLDMPILTYDFTDVIAFGAEHSTLGPIVGRAAQRMNVKLSPDPIPQEGLFTRSDHYMFVKEGVPSVFLVTGYAGVGQKASADFLANHYHKVSDDMKLPINWEAGAKFARLNYLIAREIADAPQAPQWYANSFFGKTFAPDQKKASIPAQP